MDGKGDIQFFLIPNRRCHAQITNKSRMSPFPPSRPGPSSRYVYPDLSVVCGPPQFDPADRRRTTVTNPRVVVEVLSDSTEAYDRGGKFTLYRECETLEENVLIAQDRPAFETYHRQPDGTWSFAAWSGLDAVARLRSLGVDLAMSALYAGLPFDSD